jgi:hypothetical protein
MTLMSKQVTDSPPEGVRLIREVRVRDRLLDRLLATLRETILHPFTPSVLILEDPKAADATEAAPER